MAAAILLLAAAAHADISADVDSARRDLRAQQNVLTVPELREGERRLDAIRRQGQTDPRAAEDALRIYKGDESLATINRPVPGAPPSPGLTGPGDRK